jgi:hypothetical protein
LWTTSLPSRSNIDFLPCRDAPQNKGPHSLPAAR